MNELFQQIESDELAARVGVSSGFRQFLSALSAERPVRLLRRHVAQHHSDMIAVFQRLARLAETGIDVRYEHQSDAALAAYLIVLGLADRHLHKASIDVVLAARNVWWAKKVAEAVNRGPRLTSSEHLLVSRDGRYVPRLSSQFDSYETMIPVAVRYTGRAVMSANTDRRKVAGAGAMSSGPRRLVIQRAGSVATPDRVEVLAA